MRRDARALPVRGRALSIDRLFRNRHSVAVRVAEGQRELDSLQASSLEDLRASLRPIYRHMDPREQTVSFTGIEERWLPGGLLRTRREVPLPCLDDALAFLAA